jgi:hypothetical protein
MRKLILPALVLAFFLLMPFALAQIRSVSLVQDPVFGTGQQVLLLSIGTIYSDYANFGTISASASELSQLEPSNAQILNSFTMRWKTEEEYTIYPLNFKRGIYKIDIVSSDFKWWGWSSSDETQWINLNCQDLDGVGGATYIEKKNVFGAVLQIFCAKRGEYVGDVFTIGSPQPYWKTRFEISNGYETLVDYLGTGIGYVKNINNKVYIRFDGLGLFTYPKVAGNTYVFTNYAKINLFDAGYLSDYENALANDAQYYVNQVANGQMSEATAETLINSKISPITSTWTTNPDFPYNSISWVGSTKYDIRLKYTSTERISFQNFVVYANSNFIQIKIPYSQPKILSVYTDFGSELTATKVGRVTAVIQNVGNDVATFEATLSCQQSSVFSPTQIISNINVQESRTLTWDVNAKQTDSLISDTCTLKVCDTIKTTNCDTKTISFSIKPRPVCTPGEQYASLEYNIWKVYECGSDGKYYLKFSCNPGEVPYKDQWGKYVGCKAEEKPGVSPQPQPTPTPFKIENWMWGALIGLLAFFLLGGASGFANKQYDKVGIAAVIGVIAFIIVYSVLEWWSGLAWWQKLLIGIGGSLSIGGIIYLLFYLGLFGVIISAIKR